MQAGRELFSCRLSLELQMRKDNRDLQDHGRQISDNPNIMLISSETPLVGLSRVRGGGKGKKLFKSKEWPDMKLVRMATMEQARRLVGVLKRLKVAPAGRLEVRARGLPVTGSGRKWEWWR